MGILGLPIRTEFLGPPLRFDELVLEPSPVRVLRFELPDRMLKAARLSLIRFEGAQESHGVFFARRRFGHRGSGRDLAESPRRMATEIPTAEMAARIPSSNGSLQPAWKKLPGRFPSTNPTRIVTVTLNTRLSVATSTTRRRASGPRIRHSGKVAFVIP